MMNALLTGRISGFSHGFRDDAESRRVFPSQRLTPSGSRYRWSVLILGLMLHIGLRFAVAAETNVERAIGQIKIGKIGEATTEAMITNLFGLLDTFQKPEEKGKIYFEVASLRAMTAGRTAEDVAAYCKKALEFPLALREEAQMWLFLGESFEMKMRVSAGDQVIPNRLGALDAFLKGLQVLEGKVRFTERRPLPAVAMLDVHPRSTNEIWYRKLLEDHDAQLKARNDILQQNELLQYKNILKRKIVELYWLNPGFSTASGEVLTEGRKIVRDEPLLQELIGSIQAKAAAK